MKLSLDALDCWAKVINNALKWEVKQMLIPVVSYEAGLDSEGGEKQRYETPMICNDSTTFTKELLFGMLNSTIDRPGWDDEDLALSTRVACLTRGFDGPTIRQLDIIDVEPGHVFHPSDIFNKTYHLIRTGGSYHMYPRVHVFDRNGAHVIQDVKWKGGFIRVSESKQKGALLASGY